MKTMVLFSGGVRSAALACLMKDLGRDIVLLTLSNVEPYPARKVAQELGFKHEQHAVCLIGMSERRYPLLLALTLAIEEAARMNCGAVAIGCDKDSGMELFLRHFEDALTFHPPGSGPHPVIESPFKSLASNELHGLDCFKGLPETLLADLE